VFISNYERTEKQATLPWQARDHLARREARGLHLEPYGVAIVTRSDQEIS
jgi:hypothetical protein